MPAPPTPSPPAASTTSPPPCASTTSRAGASSSIGTSPNGSSTAKIPGIPGFWHEAQCLTFLATLRAAWDGLPAGLRRWRPARRGPREHTAAALCSHPWLYRRLGHDERPITFSPDGRIARSAASCEHFWDLRAHAGRLHLEIFSATDKTLTATLRPDGTYRGHWHLFEKMPVEFSALPTLVPPTDASPIAS